MEGAYKWKTGGKWSPLDSGSGPGGNSPLKSTGTSAKIKADIAAAKARREAGDTSGHKPGKGSSVIKGTKGMTGTQAVKAAADRGSVKGKGSYSSGSQGKQGKWSQTEGERRKADPYGEKAALAARNKKRAAQGLKPL